MTLEDARARAVTLFGVEYRSLRAVAKAFGMKQQMLQKRIGNQGLSLEEAVMRPSRYQNRKSHPLYSNWNCMMTRCYNPKSISYKNYGAKGVVVCEKWRKDFWAFVADMGPKPSAEHTVDRIENSKGYEPGNCRWATQIEQKANSSKARPYMGFPTIAEAARQTGIPYRTLTTRARTERIRACHEVATPGTNAGEKQ